jgi:exonuclease SbcC
MKRRLGERVEAISEREKELAREAERIEREREGQIAELSRLPSEYQVSENAPEVLAEARERCAARLGQLQELHLDVQRANAKIGTVEAELTAQAEARRQKIDEPRRGAAGDARELVAKVKELSPSVSLPKQPPDDAAIGDHATWVSNVGELAVALAAELLDEARSGEKAGVAANEEAEGALKAANALINGQLKDGRALEHEVNAWNARVLAAEKERDKATDHAPKAALLDSQIGALRSRRESLEELARVLGDGHFIKWLVERRQQLLLVVASEIFAGMTVGRYRFAADFTVIDGRTGIARNPRTLSGGESFMASLSLALGMAELAARSGGRIGSLYLDEGFGALDPNALDEALNALELRARSGQMILVVSHVPAVAQRIERILRVWPDPAGSTAEWLDDADRETLLLEAASADV